MSHIQNQGIGLVLGVTGKAGSEFDTAIVDALCKFHPFVVVRADDAAEAAWESPAFRLRVAEEFGASLIFENAELDDPKAWVRRPRVVGRIVSADPERQAALNRIIRPFTMAYINEKISENLAKGRSVVLVATRLANTTEPVTCDETWYVDRDEERRRNTLREAYATRAHEEYVREKVDEVMEMQQDVLTPEAFKYSRSIKHPENNQELQQIVAGCLEALIAHCQWQTSDGQTLKSFPMGIRHRQFARSLVTLAALAKRGVQITDEELFEDQKLPSTLRTCLDACFLVRNGTVVVSTEPPKLQYLPGSLRRENSGHIRTDSATNISVPIVTLVALRMKLADRFECVLEGCTEMGSSSPVDWFNLVLFPLLRRIGITADLKVEKHGFRDGPSGIVRLQVIGRETLKPFELVERGELNTIAMSITCAGQAPLRPEEICREVEMHCRSLGFSGKFYTSASVFHCDKPSMSIVVAVNTDQSVLGADVTCDGDWDHVGHTNSIEILKQRLTEIFHSRAAVDRFTADKLILFLGIVGGRVRIPFVDSPVDMEHIHTQIAFVSSFLQRPIRLETDGSTLLLTVEPHSGR